MTSRMLAALFVLLFLCALPGSSHAHAFPIKSDPKVGSTIPVCPDRVRIWFDGNLEPAFSSIMVHDSKGTMVDKMDGRVNPSDPTLLEISIPKLPSGSYKVVWNAVSRDGHRTTGDFSFAIK